MSCCDSLEYIIISEYYFNSFLLIKNIILKQYLIVSYSQLL